MRKEYRYFTEAYKYYTGKLYDWDEQGNPEEQDSWTKGLYQGFMLAQKGVKQLQRENRDLIEALNDKAN